MARVYNKVYDQETWEQVNPRNKELLDDFILDLRENRRSPATVKQYFSDSGAGRDVRNFDQVTDIIKLQLKTICPIDVNERGAGLIIRSAPRFIFINFRRPQ